jgi:hypothetical protein
MPGFLYQTNGTGQDSGETERERESVRDRALLDRRRSVGNKIDS